MRFSILLSSALTIGSFALPSICAVTDGKSYNSLDAFNTSVDLGTVQGTRDHGKILDLSEDGSSDSEDLGDEDDQDEDDTLDDSSDLAGLTGRDVLSRRKTGSRSSASRQKKGSQRKRPQHKTSPGKGKQQKGGQHKGKQDTGGHDTGKHETGKHNKNKPGKSKPGKSKPGKGGLQKGGKSSGNHGICLVPVKGSKPEHGHGKSSAAATAGDKKHKGGKRSLGLTKRANTFVDGGKCETATGEDGLFTHSLETCLGLLAFDTLGNKVMAHVLATDTEGQLAVFEQKVRDMGMRSGNLIVSCPHPSTGTTQHGGQNVLQNYCNAVQDRLSNPNSYFNHFCFRPFVGQPRRNGQVHIRELSITGKAHLTVDGGQYRPYNSPSPPQQDASAS